MTNNKVSIGVFTGNRAEFGILFPLLELLEKKYNVILFVSGAHILPEWNTISEVESLLNEHRLNIEIQRIDFENKDHYHDSLTNIYSKAFMLLGDLKKTKNMELSIVLGDRVETFAYTSASFFNQIPIVHLYGGDVGNVPYFDTNLRHAITKLSHLHLASNAQSHKVLLQLGEEPWRCHDVGNLSLDNYRLGNYTAKAQLINELGLNADEKVILFTYHPSQFKSAEENFQHFKMIYDILDSAHLQTIITYPNNDEGHLDISNFLDNAPREGKIKIVKNLGIRKYLGILKELDAIVVGNSSSGLYETAYTCTPALNIGDRQTDRPRGGNVIDVPLDQLDSLSSILENIVKNYEEIKEENTRSKNFFGDGSASMKCFKQVDSFLSVDNNKRIFKLFELK